MMTADVNMAELQDKMKELTFLLGVPAATVLRVETKRLVQTLVNFTPPGNGRLGEGETPRQQGESAIKKDIFGGRKVGKGALSRGLFFVMGESIHAVKQDRDEVRLFVGKTGDVWLTDKHFFKPNASIADMDAIHSPARSRSTGRVSTAGQYPNRETGRWKQVNQMTVGRQAADRYFKHLASHVGRMRAGWLPSAEAVKLNLPNWIKRHRGVAHGFVQDQLSAPNPSITIANTFPGVGRAVGHVVNRSLQIRMAALEKNLARLIKFGAGRSGDYETAYAQGA